MALHYTVKTISYKFDYFASLSPVHSLVQKIFKWTTRVQFPARSHIHSMRLSDRLLDPAGIYTLCDGLMWPEWVAVHLPSLTTNVKSARKLIYTRIIICNCFPAFTVDLHNVVWLATRLRHWTKEAILFAFFIVRAYEDGPWRRLKNTFLIWTTK